MAGLKPWAKPSWVENDSGVLMPSEQAVYITSEDSSVTLTYTDLDPDTDPAGVGATQVDLSASGGGGSSADTGFIAIDGPTGTPIPANAATPIIIPAPVSWGERAYSRVVVALIITHPNVSELAGAITDGTNTSALFDAGSFSATANLGDPTGPQDPDAFLYFSDWGEADLQLTADSGLDPSADTGPDAAPNVPNSIFCPVGPLSELAQDPIGDLTLTITESGGHAGTVDAVIVYLISEEFDAVRGFISPGGAGTISVTDGTTTVAGAKKLSFTGATVSNGGSGVADIAISGMTVTKTTVAFDAAGLNNGVEIYTPAVDEVWFDCFIILTENWDGVTPFGDIGRGLDGYTSGIWQDEANWSPYLDLHNGGGIDPPPNNEGMIQMSSLRSFSIMSAIASTIPTLAVSGTALEYQGSSGTSLYSNASPLLPAIFSTADPVKFWVTKTGLLGDPAPGATQGSVDIYLITAKP